MLFLLHGPEKPLCILLSVVPHFVAALTSHEAAAVAPCAALWVCATY